MAAYDSLRQRIIRQRDLLRDPFFIERLLGDSLTEMIHLAPKKSGRLRRNLNTKSPVESRPWGMFVRGGLFDEIGFPNNTPPSGTIAAFLRDFPEFKRKGTYSRRGPWWSLPREGKAMLEYQRMQGRYGGGYGGAGFDMSAYLYAQEGSHPAWYRSAAKAGITPDPFAAIGWYRFLTSRRPYWLREFKERFQGL